MALHVLGSGDEVIEDIKLLHQCSGKVPRLAVLGTAAEVDGDVDAAVFEPYKTIGAEGRVERDVEASVSVEVHGISAVGLDVAASRHEHGHACAVLACDEYLLGDVIIGVEVRNSSAEQRRAVARDDVVAVSGCRVYKAREAVEHLGVLARGAERYRAVGRERDFADLSTLDVVEVGVVGRITVVGQNHTVSAYAVDRHKRSAGIGHYGAPIARTEIVEADGSNAVVGSIDTCV